MVIRKLTLAEWFLRFQLLKLAKNHFYLPIELDLDVTDLYQYFESQNKRIPVTAYVIKLAAMLRKSAPYSHRIIFPTLFGPRLLEASQSIVNVPIILNEKGLEILTAITIKDADQKTLSEINHEIKCAKQRPLKDYPIVNFVSRSKNNFIHRSLLRALYFLAYCVPQVYIKKGGGGICVSSLFNNHHEDFRNRPYAYGPTALTFCLSSIVELEKKYYLRLGIGYDHTAFSGNEVISCLKLLKDISNQFQHDFLNDLAYIPKEFQDRDEQIYPLQH